jgi:hypothetical protein
MKGVRPIILAGETGNIPMLTRLIKSGADVNYVIPKNMTNMR